eukprot:TRINITY_DN6005_c0_g3_i1.p1 TRINITY_DN6005_c0_g3~~TRINITY_DN6005_c0_g3_i1.p1  ORF type:complete len:139 (+),score=21.18 TRINITY_DN6005_c0_g3_i1:231-647(+)
MPHCGRALYHNLLCCNWHASHLASLAILGNSFHSYSDRLTLAAASSSLASSSSASFLRVLQVVSERPCSRVDFDVMAAFNDLALHVFEDVKLRTVEPDFWQGFAEYVAEGVGNVDPELIPTSRTNSFLHVEQQEIKES